MVKMNRTCDKHGEQGDECISFCTDNPSKGTNDRFYCLICFEDMIAENCCKLKEDRGYMSAIEARNYPGPSHYTDDPTKIWVYDEDICKPTMSPRLLHEETFFGIIDKTHLSAARSALDFEWTEDLDSAPQLDCDWKSEEAYNTFEDKEEKKVDYMKAIRDACK